MPYDAGGQGGFRELSSRLRRRLGLILAVTLVLTGLAAFVAYQITPLYTATTKVMIEVPEVPRPQILSTEDVVAGITPKQEAVAGEIHVLTSRDLAAQVVERLRLMENPDFNPAIAEDADAPSTAGWLREGVAQWLAALGAGLNDAAQAASAAVFSSSAAPDDGATATAAADPVDMLLEKLSVETDGRSTVIVVSATTLNPELSSKIVNTLTDVYLEAQIAAKSGAAGNTVKLLGGRVDELRQQVTAAEQAVDEFRRKAGLVDAKGVSLASQQVSDLSTELTRVRATRAEVEARLEQVQALVRSGDTSSAGEVTSSNLIQRLKEQEAEVMRRHAEMSARLGPNHPDMKAAQAELRDIRGKISQEVRALIQNLRNEANIARNREATLTDALQRASGTANRVSSEQGRLMALEREAEARRAMYEAVQSRFNQIVSEQGLNFPSARVVSRADPPTTPSFPKRSMLIVLAFVASLGVATGGALLLEASDNGLRSSEQVEAVLGTTTLGLVPDLEEQRRALRRPEEHVLQRPSSMFSEAIRSVHAGVKLSSLDRPPRSILFTSALPGEGKTAIATALSRAQAKSGRRVLLIDADLRRAQVGTIFRLRRAPGLADVLEGGIPWRDAIQIDEDSGLAVLVAGTASSASVDLLSSEAMRSLIEEASREYLTIIDSPPVMVVSDAQGLANLVDTTVFVVQWGETPRQVAQLGMKRIRDAGARVAGVILSKVDARRHAQYGFADSTPYSSRVRAYYDRT